MAITIKTITVERTYTINLGNFESAKFGATFTADINEDDDPLTAYEELADLVDGVIQNDIEAFNSDGSV